MRRSRYKAVPAEQNAIFEPAPQQATKAPWTMQLETVHEGVSAWSHGHPELPTRPALSPKTAAGYPRRGGVLSALASWLIRLVLRLLPGTQICFDFPLSLDLACEDQQICLQFAASEFLLSLPRRRELPRHWPRSGAHCVETR